MLTRTEELLNKTISNWRSWNVGDSSLTEQPEIVAQMRGGMTNQSFLTSSGDFKAVVRVNADNSHALGINRERETFLLKKAWSTGCVPRLFFADEDTQVTQLIPGRMLNSDDIKDKSIQDKLERCIGSIQTTDRGNLTVRKYMDYIDLYANQVPSFNGLLDITYAAKFIDASDWLPVVCHHDLVPENIIINGTELYFIDWEYGHLGHPLIDHIKLFGADYCVNKGSRDVIDALLVLQEGIVKLWYALQDSVGKNFNKS